MNAEIMQVKDFKRWACKLFQPIYFLENRTKAIELLNKILNNIIANPAEPKFRKIKCSNKNIAEKVASQKGAFDFLKSVGWEEVDIEEDGKCLLFNNEDTNKLAEGLEALNDQDDLPEPTLHRNPKVLTPTEAQTRISVP